MVTPSRAGEGGKMILPCFSINHIMKIVLVSFERENDKRQEAKVESSVRWHLSPDVESCGGGFTASHTLAVKRANDNFIPLCE